VHLSYMQQATSDWVVAHGGRCYRVSECKAGLRKQVRCPICVKEKWLNDMDGYIQHWEAVHNVQYEMVVD